ncbi:profilin [Mytilus galloprovincialis]|uniref:Profilin n=1 Tax=Mytilus galloprovincialis TaxID=29158 RepID=A0A8B6GPS2_MYTGA|nr:profilin [Mytilus galloprovincialis]
MVTLESNRNVEKGRRVELPPILTDTEMPCTWKEYVNNVLLDSNYVSRAAILGNDGKSWATSTGFYVSPAELREIIPAFVDSTKIRNEGICLNNKRYTCTRMDSTIMVGREIATGFGCVIFKYTTIPEVWSPGERRVFEPAELQQRLMDGCEFCGEELRFTRVVSETVCAMGSIIYITCDCGMLNKINSGKVHYEKGKQRTRPIFDINTKIAIAMYDTGLGPHQVNRFFTNINLPGISQTSLKKREREVFEPIKQVAKRSLDDSLEEEKKASERLSVSNSGDNAPVSVKYDMGWQKRGSGRKYNLKSGVGSMIGHLTGKLIDLDLLSYWEGKGKEQPKHNCI